MFLKLEGVEYQKVNILIIEDEKDELTIRGPRDQMNKPCGYFALKMSRAEAIRVRDVIDQFVSLRVDLPSTDIQNRVSSGGE